MKTVNNDICHDLIVKGIKPLYSFDENKDFETQKKQVRKKFIELTGLDLIKKNACPLNFEIETTEELPTYTKVRFTIESEKGCVVPAVVLIPKLKKEKYPVCILLQGHSTGFHISFNEARYKNDEADLPRCATAVQAVENGFLAVAIEQRGRGEAKPLKEKRAWGGMCNFTALSALMLGRTVLGERIWDVSKVIDALSNFKEADLSSITITGNSGGGTSSFYCACYDNRITLCAPSCAFCPYPESILDIFHCSCNYIPNAYRYFDMQDLSILIAPRMFTPISGKEDIIFPINGVERGFETVKKIYDKANAKDNCKLIVTPKHHYWMPEIVWPSIKENYKKIDNE